MQKAIGSLRPTVFRSCRCAQCTTPQGSTVARRAGTVAGSGLRPTLLTSTTLLCSSIFTAAAMIDADSKTRRRQQWDDAIQGLEQEIVAARNRNETAQDMLVDPSKDWIDLAVEAENWPVNTGHTLQADRLPSLNSVYAPAGSQIQGAWTPKKTAIVNITTKRLELMLLRLIRQENYNLQKLLELNTSSALLDLIPNETSNRPMPSPEPSTAIGTLQKWLTTSKRVIRGQIGDLELDIRRIWKAQWNLQDLAQNSDDSWLVGYAARKPTHQRIQELNSRLREIFRAADSSIGSRYLCLALVGHTLATSETAPNLSTYNILLAGLSKLEIKYATSYAIHSLRRCNLRPNEVTLSIILQHYVHRNNHAGFQRWIDIIQGEHGGLSLAHCTEQSAATADAMRIRAKAGHDSKTIELPCPTPKVFSAIIAGKLHFEGIDAAMEICRLMGSQGWGVELDALGPLLRDCVRRKDVGTGEQIWRLARQLQSKAENLYSQQQVSAKEKIPEHVYAAMLRLYEDAGAKTQLLLTKREFEHVWPFSTMLSTERPVNDIGQTHFTNSQDETIDLPEDAHTSVLSTHSSSLTATIPSATILPTDASSASSSKNDLDVVQDNVPSDEMVSEPSFADHLSSVATLRSRSADTPVPPRKVRRSSIIGLRPEMLGAFAYTPSRERHTQYLEAA